MNKLWPLTVCLVLILSAGALAQGGEVASAVDRAADSVCDKHVVLLGELGNHGEGAAFEAKARIVRRLVERCGFDAVLFEAPIYDFLGFEAAVARRAATQGQLDNAIGRFWTTRELADWRTWLYEQAVAGKLIVGGLDDQVSVTSEYARATLPALVAAHVPSTKTVECEQAVSRNLYWRYDTATPFDDAEQRRLRSCTDEAVKKGAGSFQDQTPDQIMRESLAGYVQRQTKAPKAWDRDKAMFRNFLWYAAQRIGSQGKTIIWTATVHAARKQGPLAIEPTGTRLAGLLGHRLGVIGFTAFAGRSSVAGQPAKDLPEAPSGSLEALTTRENGDWVLVNSSELKRLGKVPSRLFGEFAAPEDWSRYFDAVLVIRREVAPTFEPKTATSK